MTNLIIVEKKLKKFNKKISVSGDKSISIRWVLFASLANGPSKAQNLLISEDVMAAINAIRKFGIKVFIKGKFCKIYGNGVDGYKFTDNLTLKLKQPASGTLQTITWQSNPASDHEFYWAGGSSNAPTITNTLAAHDLFGFYTHDGGSTIYSFKLGQDLK